MKIVIIGTGNVAYHLAKALRNFETKVINPRTLENLKNDSDVILIAVADSAIKSVAEAVSTRLQGYAGVAAHTAGSVGISVLKPFFRHYGVFYPLQTFSKELEIANYHEIPVFIEASDGESEQILAEVAMSFSDKCQKLDSAKRERMHLASVFASNFVNAIYCMAAELLEKEKLPFDTIRPLIEMTARKAMSKTPIECQTGPAKRGDVKVMEKHLKDLEEDKELQEIYSLLSRYIQVKNTEK